MLYESDTWLIIKIHHKKLKVCQQSMIRRMMKLSWKKFVSNEKVLTPVETEFVGHISNIRRIIKWIGPVIRIDDNRVPTELLHGVLETEKKNIGRQKLR